MTIPPRRPGLSRPGSSGRSPQPALPSLLPDDDDKDEEKWNEHTPVTDMPAMFKKVGQTASMIRQLVKGEMPALREQVKESISAAQNAQREAFDAKTEATLAKERIEDVRQRVESLEPLKVNGAKREVRLASLEDRLEKAGSHRWWVWGTVITIVLTGLGSIGAAIWWASDVSASVRHESEQRAIADDALIKNINTKLDNLPTREETLTRSELKELRGELTKNREPTVQEWIDSLPPSKRQAARRLLGDAPSAVQ